MKTLKLEVGKTYRSRKGKEVGIVRAIYSRIWPFCGDNGKSYNEQGRCYSVNLDDSEDLIEEVPETQHTFALVAGALTANRYVFNIPEDVKRVIASREGNRIIVEMVPEKGPKPGDVCINEKGSVYIFKEVAVIGTHKSYAWFGKSGRLSRSSWLAMDGLCYPGRPATPEEAQPLFDALEKAGKRWNSETMQVEDVPEKGPKPGDVMVNKFESVYLFKGVASHNRHSYFAVVGRSGRTVYDSVTIPGRPATPEEAQLLWDALKKAGKRWNHEAMQVEDDVDAVERCRIMDYLEGFANDETWNHEQLCWLIEVYLDRKGNEK